MGAIIDPEQLNQILYKRDKLIKGGVDVLFIGLPGCGKTTGMALIAVNNKRLHNDVIIWRASQNCQWTYLLYSEEKIVFWIKEGLKYLLFDRKTGKTIKLEDYVYKVKRYKNEKELVEKLDKRHINVIQTTPYSPLKPRQHTRFCKEWVSIFDNLCSRMWKNSVSVFFDELEDMAPEGMGKDLWDVVLAFSSIIRNMRKNEISSHLACHSKEEVHWRIRKKIRWKLLMKGARPDKNSRININTYSLDIGEGILESDRFERFKFAYIGEDMLLRSVVIAPDIKPKVQLGYCYDCGWKWEYNGKGKPQCANKECLSWNVDICSPN